MTEPNSRAEILYSCDLTGITAGRFCPVGSDLREACPMAAREFKKNPNLRTLERT